MNDDIIRRLSSTVCPCCIDVLAAARDEIERLRLTAEELEAIEAAAAMLKRDVADLCDGKVRADATRLVKSLRALLKRLA